ncbi:MAG: hypothetical protein QOG05_2339 [Streptosporangiaceae bacterium]|nr:hypothetical protein [Streptosporangiaceae bacterium]
MRRWRNPVVDVEAEVAITPVQRPLPGRLGVVQPGDGEARPLRAHVFTPGRPALHDRQMPRRDVAFHLDLVAHMRGDALLAPATRPSHVQLRKTRFHPDSLSVTLLRMTGSAAGSAQLAGVSAGCHQMRTRTTMTHMAMVYRCPVGVMRQSVKPQLASWAGRRECRAGAIESLRSRVLFEPLPGKARQRPHMGGGAPRRTRRAGRQMGCRAGDLAALPAVWRAAGGSRAGSGLGAFTRGLPVGGGCGDRGMRH